MSISSIASRTRRYILACLVSSLSISFIPCIALAADEESKGFYIPAGTAAKNFYGGVGPSVGRTNSPDSNQDGSVTSVSTDDSTNGVGVFVG